MKLLPGAATTDKITLNFSQIGFVWSYLDTRKTFAKTVTSNLFTTHFTSSLYGVVETGNLLEKWIFFSVLVNSFRKDLELLLCISYAIILFGVNFIASFCYLMADMVLVFYVGNSYSLL